MDRSISALPTITVTRKTYRKNKYRDTVISKKVTPIRCKKEWVDVEVKSNRGPAALERMFAFGK